MKPEACHMCLQNISCAHTNSPLPCGLPLRCERQNPFRSSLFTIFVVISSFMLKIAFLVEVLFFCSIRFWKLFLVRSSGFCHSCAFKSLYSFVIRCRTETSLCILLLVFATYVTYAFLFGCRSSFIPITWHTTTCWVTYKRFFRHKLRLNTRQKQIISCLICNWL